MMSHQGAGGHNRSPIYNHSSVSLSDAHLSHQSSFNSTSSAPTNNDVDKYKKFENEGVVFKAKLIGSELVMEPRGDKMCQNSIQRLKAIIKGTNSHKKRIVLKISYDGVKIYDEKTNEILHHHEVSQISYIASDDTDNRTFGYVSDVPNKAHQFICFKTSGPAINIMSVISALFEAVLEKKNMAEKERQKQLEESQSVNSSISNNNQKMSLSIDLIDDSGIVDSGLESNINPFGFTTTNTITTSATSAAFDIKVPQRTSANPSILRRQNSNNNNSQPPILLPPPSSLPRPAPMMSQQGAGGHNRSLIYNHSSVSLSDAHLSHQSSFNSTSSAPTNNDSYVDRYAVFNDIDNLPSIFESTSLGNVNHNNNNSMSNINNNSSSNFNNNSSSNIISSGSNNNIMFRQTNPFDDDFFA